MRTTRTLLLVSTALLAAFATFVAAQATGKPAAAGVPGLDEQYLMTSTAGDLFEIQGGKLALSHSTNPTVTALGSRLKKDHHKSYKEATALAKKLGAKSETSPEPSQQWELSVLGTLSGSAFDKQYTALEVQDHMQDIAEATYEAKNGANPEVRKDAKGEIPILKTHLKLSKQALKAVSG